MLQIGFVFAHDLVSHGSAAVFIFQINRGAKHHAAAGIQTCGVDDLRSGQLAFHFNDATFDEALLLLRGFVFGVFAQITLSACFGNGLNDGGTLHSLQALQFSLELFCSALGDWDGGHDRVSKFSKRRALRGTFRTDLPDNVKQGPVPQKQTAARCRAAVQIHYR